MPDVFLYPGQANPNDVALRDPTTVGAPTTYEVSLTETLTASDSIVVTVVVPQFVVVPQSQGGGTFVAPRYRPRFVGSEYQPRVEQRSHVVQVAESISLRDSAQGVIQTSGFVSDGLSADDSSTAEVIPWILETVNFDGATLYVHNDLSITVETDLGCTIDVTVANGEANGIIEIGLSKYPYGIIEIPLEVINARE